MKNLLKATLIALCFYSCKTPREKIEGAWKMVDHQTYNYSMPLHSAFFPFETLIFKGDSVWVDSVPSVLVTEENQIRFDINGQVHEFEIPEGDADRFVYLKSKTIKPGGMVESYYYFKRTD